MAPRSGANRRSGIAKSGAVLVIALTGLAACSTSSHRSVGATTSTSAVSTSSSSTSTTGSPSTAVADQEEIVSRYEAYWNARFQANQPPPNPDFAGLRDVATGAQLDQVIAETRTNLQQRTAIRHAAHPNGFQSVKVTSADGTVASVQECVVDDDVTFNFDSGAVVDDSIATHNVAATMRRVDGEWKVDGIRLVQRWEGVAGCAVAQKG